ncbi:MAG: polysaccharide biosynthesis/export family protein [Rubripirellula sp.]
MLNNRNPLLSLVMLLPTLLACCGCSSLGLSVFPTGHFLTDQAEAVLDQTASNRALHSTVPHELDLGVVSTHFLQPGDVLLIEPVDLDTEIRIPADQRVLIDGSIDLGEFGRIVVAGLTVESAEKLIQRSIVDAGLEKQDVNVRLLEPVSRFYVLGEVNSPGSYPLDGNETVLDGILAAGGLTSAAAPCKILLARPTESCSCRVTLPVCYREITQLGDTATNYQLQPGDRVFVSTRSWCEDLKFWEATKTCTRCCGRQTACPDPAIAERGNPIRRVSGGAIGTAQLLESPPLQSDARPIEAATQAINVEDSPNAFDFPTDRSTPAASVVQEASSYQPEGGNNPIESPDRMPITADGELEFGDRPLDDRFEPLWIKPSEQ